ncbi:aminopeptidase P family protein [Polycladomyces sp. WAk]|uniref:Aminopeptidase P family protein n=1 Tax=Polycladomyces zharkentensis TaxID=2807616 RepID=A0ABS2WK00_9BACL|nr:aminopeptidase P family protein [Polycladomyces sp. WAk]
MRGGYLLKKRIDRLRERLKEQDLEALLVTHPMNRRYLTGFTGTAGMVLVTEKEAKLLVDFRYVEQAQKQAPHLDVVRVGGEPFRTVAGLCREWNVSRLAFEQDHLVYARAEKLKSILDGVEVVPVSNMVEKLRETKDADELETLRRAARIVDEVFAEILKEIRPGLRERDIAFRLEFLMREKGADSSSFDIIVASGPRSALPHGVASDRVLEKGDLVTLDFGALYEGYCSDITRTIVLGKPNERQREIYDIVLHAQQAALEAVRPGVTGRDVDKVARDIITDRGYGEQFGHSTGHGIGLEIHEAPTLSVNGETVLQSGMVVTVEPGIYLPGFGGVRIEDDVVVTEQGKEVLTHSPKNLIVIE